MAELGCAVVLWSDSFPIAAARRASGVIEKQLDSFAIIELTKK
jgi:hypothetical protein